MTNDELIARQAKKIEELQDTIEDYEETIRNVMNAMVCIGGPLNDNKLGYTKEQLRIFHGMYAMLDLLEISPEKVYSTRREI